jgi:hypothetical protein
METVWRNIGQGFVLSEIVIQSEANDLTDGTQGILAVGRMKYRDPFARLKSLLGRSWLRH